MLTFTNLAEFSAHAGKPLGETDYLTITQERIELFAEATGDHQWIHTNPTLAAQHSPFKTTIAHGFLTLSLAPTLMAELYRINSVTMGINYGANKIRFMHPVPVGSRLQMKATLLQAEPQHQGIRSTIECTFMLEGQAKPACVAELITLLFEGVAQGN